VHDDADFVLRDTERTLLLSAMADSSRRLVVVAGPAGVGKTRLVEHCLAEHVARGGLGRRCIANVSLSSVPFGALAGLMRGDLAGHSLNAADRLAAYSSIVDHLRVLGATDQQPFVLCVDDIHDLDEASSGLLAQLVAGGPVQVVCTYRTGMSLPAGVAALWSVPSLLRLDVAAFSRDELDVVVDKMLGAATPEVREELWSRSHGNALHLRELIVGSVTSGSIARRGELWVLERPLSGSAHLAEYVRSRFDALDPVSRTVVDMLALCQPLPLAVFDHDQATSIDQLHAAALADVDALTFDVRLAHPVYAEVLSTLVSTVRKQRLLGEVIDRIEARRAIPPTESSAASAATVDSMRTTVWQLDAGRQPSLEALIDAAVSARDGRDNQLVERLARIAWTRQPGHYQAAQLLVDALYELGRFDESVQITHASIGAVNGPEQAAALISGLYRTQLWGLDDADGALATVQVARAGVTSGSQLDFLTMAAANALAFSDRPGAALDEIERADDARRQRRDGGSAADPFIEIRQAVLAQLGRTADALDQPSPTPLPALHAIIRSFALSEHGSVDEAALTSEQLRVSLVHGTVPLDRMWAALTAARAHLIAGRMRQALIWANDGLITAESASLVAGQALALSLVAAAAAQVDDLAQVREADARAARLQDVRGFLRAERFVGSAWAAYTANEHSRARQLLLDGAAMAADAGQPVSESFLLFERVRLGGSPDPTRLHELASKVQSPLVAARAAFVAAAADRSGAGLERAGDSFAALGCRLYAAEAYVLASSHLTSPARQRALRRRADECLAECGGANTPLLDSSPAGVPAKLSRRELEIAALAAEGLSARAIGERLVVSVRTVENHLQHVYTKLGVAGRQQLASALRERSA
jgi:DNA-binding CsgD family transcriptional regulator